MGRKKIVKMLREGDIRNEWKMIPASKTITSSLVECPALYTARSMLTSESLPVPEPADFERRQRTKRWATKSMRKEIKIPAMTIAAVVDS